MTVQESEQSSCLFVSATWQHQVEEEEERRSCKTDRQTDLYMYLKHITFILK